MGTSSSSSGSPSGTPMVPPWAPDLVPPSGAGSGDEHGAPPEGDASDQEAPHGRFQGARRSLGRFAGTGSPDDMRKGVGHYLRKGLGGGTTALRRFGGTVRTAGKLFDALSAAAAAGQVSEPGNGLDPAILAGRSADEVMAAVVEAVRSMDGTLDTEASRNAIKSALSDLLRRFPDADLLSLSEEQRMLAVERYIAWDVFNRFELDVGKTIQEKSPSAESGLSRLKEVREFIMETVAVEFRKLTAGATALDRREIMTIVQRALSQAISVFEGYV